MNRSGTPAPAEDHDRLELEEQAKSGLRQEESGRLKAAKALKEIRDRNLWPQTIAWPEYVFRTFGITAERADQLIAFAEVRDALRGGRLPDNERQTRALRQADKHAWQSIWDRACKASGRKRTPTSRLIEKIIRKDLRGEAGNHAPTAPDEHDELEHDAVEQQPVSEDYVLDVELAVNGAADPDRIEKLFGEKWPAVTTDTEDDGGCRLQFECPASEVPDLTDRLAQLLEKDVGRLIIQVEKKNCPSQPVTFPVSQPGL